MCLHCSHMAVGRFEPEQLTAVFARGADAGHGECSDGLRGRGSAAGQCEGPGCSTNEVDPVGELDGDTSGMSDVFVQEVAPLGGPGATSMVFGPVVGPLARSRGGEVMQEQGRGADSHEAQAHRPDEGLLDQECAWPRPGWTGPAGTGFGGLWLGGRVYPARVCRDRLWASGIDGRTAKGSQVASRSNRRGVAALFGTSHSALGGDWEVPNPRANPSRVPWLRLPADGWLRVAGGNLPKDSLFPFVRLGHSGQRW